MALKCQSPSCDHEFNDAINIDEVEASNAGVTPYFTHVFDPDDGFGVATSYLCSKECAVEYLEEVA